MDADILCSLLSQKINPTKFQIWGLEIHWMSPEHDTPENMAIVEDVIENYESLKTAYLLAETKGKDTALIKKRLLELDQKAIRSIREWIAKQGTAPTYAKDYENQAIAERLKLK